MPLIVWITFCETHQERKSSCARLRNQTNETRTCQRQWVIMPVPPHSKCTKAHTRCSEEYFEHLITKAWLLLKIRGHLSSSAAPSQQPRHLCASGVERNINFGQAPHFLTPFVIVSLITPGRSASKDYGDIYIQTRIMLHCSWDCLFALHIIIVYAHINIYSCDASSSAFVALLRGNL
jgi:hypothetical protein